MALCRRSEAWNGDTVSNKIKAKRTKWFRQFKKKKCVEAVKLASHFLWDVTKQVQLYDVLVFWCVTYLKNKNTCIYRNLSVWTAEEEPRHTKNSAVPRGQQVKGYGSLELRPNCVVYARAETITWLIHKSIDRKWMNYF